MASLIWSATLSGWPSETDSEVNRKELRMSGRRSFRKVDIRKSLYAAPLAAPAAQHNAADDQQQAHQHGDEVAEARERGRGRRGGRDDRVDDAGLAPVHLLDDLALGVDHRADSRGG